MKLFFSAARQPFADQLRRAMLLVPAMLPLLTACETAIDVPEPEHTPSAALVLTLDNLAGADTLRRQQFAGRIPFVSVSQRLYDMSQLNGRTDATVEVRNSGGTVVERYRPLGPPPPGGPIYYYSTGQYRPVLRYQFQPGQQYSVRVSVPGIQPAESQLTMPSQVPVQVTVTPLSSGNNGGVGVNQGRARVTVSFDDPSSDGDYYLVTARVIDPNGQGNGYSYLNIEDDNNDTGVTTSPYRISGTNSYGLYPFSDSNLNGQRISFSSNVSYYSNGMPGSMSLDIEVTLSHLTRDLYLFYNSYKQYSDSDGNPFAEPVPLYSNVRSGFGIFGGATDAAQRVRLP